MSLNHLLNGKELNISCNTADCNTVVCGQLEYDGSTLNERYFSDRFLPTITGVASRDAGATFGTEVMVLGTTYGAVYMQINDYVNVKGSDLFVGLTNPNLDTATIRMSLPPGFLRGSTYPIQMNAYLGLKSNAINQVALAMTAPTYVDDETIETVFSLASDNTADTLFKANVPLFLSYDYTLKLDLA